MFVLGPSTRVSVVGRIRSPLFLLGGYGFYLTIALYLMGSHHSHYLGSGELVARARARALSFCPKRCPFWVRYGPQGGCGPFVSIFVSLSRPCGTFHIDFGPVRRSSDLLRIF